jgi:hypothetical protein
MLLPNWKLSDHHNYYIHQGLCFANRPSLPLPLPTALHNRRNTTYRGVTITNTHK